jgi:methionyl-tRNA synthetase
MPRPVYVTTSIPYVNAAPHVGHALEFVLADALARYHRLAGAPTRLQSGSDDNSLKNVLAAEREGVPVRTLVDRHAHEFEELLHTLGVRADGFLRTSVEPVHAEGAAALWRACRARGDLYRRRYRGLYCVGCEQFYTPDELDAGLCPEHATAPETIEEENWFFRLSRYQAELLRLVDTGELGIVPETRRREARTFIAGGLQDFSVSRSRERARGWGVPVPDDPDQVMYVWFDALANYVTALGYPRRTDAYRTFWENGRTVHVIGKGILRFHAVYWPALLLSARLPLPDTILVHGHLQAAGAKLSKSRGVQVRPDQVGERVGYEALRYWLLRAVGQGDDADFTEERVRELRRSDLANELGNLVQRTVSMVRSYRGGIVPAATADAECGLPVVAAGVAERVEAAIAERLDPQAALAAVWDLVRAANRYVNETQPWQLARAGREDALDGVLLSLAESLRIVAESLRPFLPGTAGDVAAQLGVRLAADDWRAARRWSGAVAGSVVAEPQPLFPREPGASRAPGAPRTPPRDGSVSPPAGPAAGPAPR